jgi:4-diphosphocytidyl-2-C-methyl-D-erythritol kinase
VPELPAVLINPGVAVPTKDVFAALGAPALAAPVEPDDFLVQAGEFDGYLAAFARRRNDLEAPALKLQPVIGEVLAALRAQACRLARMSGSGATCYGLFATQGDAKTAAEGLQAAHPGWWVRATSFSCA